MNTCDACKHWDKEVIETVYEDMTVICLYRMCRNPKVNGDHPLQHQTPEGVRRYYQLAVAKGAAPPGSFIESEDKHTIPLDQSTPSAADEHNICFLTGPKFGCIHFEPKA